MATTTSDSAESDPMAGISDDHVTKWIAKPVNKEGESSAFGTLQVVLRVILILGVTASLCAMAGIVRVVIQPFDYQLARRCLDFLVGAWADAIVGGPVLPAGCELLLSGELPHPRRRAAILIVNHQLDVDWLYVWELLRVVQAHGALKIVLLEDMKTVPIVGWAMRLVGFVFVSRGKFKGSKELGRSSDLSAISEGVAEAARGEGSSIVLLFPEGTTSNCESKRKAEMYATKVGRPQHSLLVVPRSAGFVAALRGFESAGLALEEVAVYDSTMAYAGYQGEVPKWELGFERERDVTMPNVARLFKGVAPDFVRMHTKAYRASDIFDKKRALPADAEVMASKWLDERWTAKNILMEQFAANGDFDSASCGEAVCVTPERKIWPFAVLTSAWIASMTSAALAATIATLLLMPLVIVATFCTVVAVLLSLPLIACAAVAFAPLLLAFVAARTCLLRAAARQAPPFYVDEHFDDDDHDGEPSSGEDDGQNNHDHNGTKEEEEEEGEEEQTTAAATEDTNGGVRQAQGSKNLKNKKKN